MKLLIFDSSSLITLTLNGLDYLIEKLKKNFQGKFIITREVKYETIDRPSNTKKFELGALKIKKLLDDKTLEMPFSLDISEGEIRERKKEILREANSSFSAKNEFMHIIDEGEASCLALSLIAGKRGIESAIVIDERTTRMLCESPENLRELFEKKLHMRVEFRNKLDFLRKMKFIRTSEIVYFAYKKNLIDLKDHNVLDALLYAVKFKGCSISRQEIDEMKRL